MNLMATGDVETAETHLRQALILQDQINNPLDKGGNLGNLGLALARLGKYDEAKTILLEGLEIVLHTHGYLPLIETLPGIALTLAQTGPPQPALALKTHALLQSQPYYTTSHLFQDMSGHLLTQFAATQPPDEVEAALKWGREIELWEGTAELLIALQESWNNNTDNTD
jgi:tetratricopeptide (TPR) repeat protein